MPVVGDIVYCLGDIDEQRSRLMKRENWVWMLPVVGSIKVNVDKLLLAESSSCGIKGILRDSNERILL